IRAADVAELGRIPGVLQHRVPAFRPMKVSNQPAGERMAGRYDPEQIPHLAFKTSGTKRMPRQGWHMRMRAVQRDRELDAAVAGGGEKVDRPQLVFVVMARDEGDPEPAVEQRPCQRG